jgi:oxygen-independent coproporphyrinogen-3 oxidase
MPETSQTAALADETGVGSYFVANYPPFSVWSPEAVQSEALPALRREAGPTPETRPPLGLYLHIPFCRKRCHFCYFRVYTNKNAQDVTTYLDVLAREWDLYAGTAAIAGRPLDFVYFGGGTPSFLSTAQLTGLVGRLARTTSWSSA